MTWKSQLNNFTAGHKEEHKWPSFHTVTAAGESKVLRVSNLTFQECLFHCGYSSHLRTGVRQGRSQTGWAVKEASVRAKSHLVKLTMGDELCTFSGLGQGSAKGSAVWLSGVEDAPNDWSPEWMCVLPWAQPVDDSKAKWPVINRQSCYLYRSEEWQSFPQEPEYEHLWVMISAYRLAAVAWDFTCRDEIGN